VDFFISLYTYYDTIADFKVKSRTQNQKQKNNKKKKETKTNTRQCPLSRYRFKIREGIGLIQTESGRIWCKDLWSRWI